MAERSKAADCKSVRNTRVGSNPTFLIVKKYNFKLRLFTLNRSQSVKHVVLKPKNFVYNYKYFSVNFLFRNNPNLFLWDQKLFEHNTLLLGFFKMYSSPLFLIKPLLYFLTSYIYILNFKPSKVVNFLNLNPYLNTFKKILLLNFKRSRFFPTLRNTSGGTLLTLSLGLFSSFFKKGKFFIKNKSVYLTVVGFLRKILIYINVKQFLLFVKHTPLYLNEMLNMINNPVINFYKNPFTGDLVNENFLLNKFYFNTILFTVNKNYGFMKSRKKGRIKRKITKRITTANRLVD
jgi:hypothetical protein